MRKKAIEARSKYSKPIRSIAVMLFALLVLGSSFLYFRFVSTTIFEESSEHLSEIYTQIERSIDDLVSERWNIMDVWVPYLQDMNDEDQIYAYLEQQQEQWGFTEFYFVSSNGEYRTLDGIYGYLNLGSDLTKLIDEQKPIVVDAALPGSPELKVFAIPLAADSYKDYHYQAIAISYDNDDIVNILQTSTFNGQSDSYLVYPNGRVLVNNENIDHREISNFLAYLESDTDMAKEDVESLRQSFSEGLSGVTAFKANGESFYLVYCPIQSQDWMLLGVVPVDVVNASMSDVLTVTIVAIVCIVMMVFVALILYIVRQHRRSLEEKDAEIQYQQALFSTLSDNIDDVFLMLDAEDLNVSYISPNIESVLGIPEEEMRTNVSALRRVSRAFDGDSIFDSLSSISQGERKEWNREIINAETGDSRYLYIVAYRTEVNETECFVLVLSDCTRERNLNHSLNEALEIAQSANKAKSNFLTNMSHDLRTPINAIMGFSELLNSDAEKGEIVREYASKISSSSQHLLEIVNDILDMKKIESGKTVLNIADFSLSDLMKEQYDIILQQAQVKNQKLDMCCKGNYSDRVMGDKTRLSQILLNLLSNAVKYTPAGGHIRFSLEGENQFSGDKVLVRFTVADDGYGMSEEFQKKLFDPFSREETQQKQGIQGTGLGMAITKNIVDLMGGTITVKSRPGEGSTFVIELLLLSAESEGNEEKCDQKNKDKEMVENASIEGMRILVAEDGEMNAFVIKALLDREGAISEIASNGEEALRMFESSVPGTYDVIFMDIQMPVMNGYEASRAIRLCNHPEASSIPIVALTANAYEEDIKKALEAGMNAHLAKPINIETMKQVIHHLQTKESAEGVD